MPRLLRLFDEIRRAWTAEDDLHMRKVAQRYADRSWMNGDVVQRTGEVVPRESA